MWFALSLALSAVEANASACEWDDCSDEVEESSLSAEVSTSGMTQDALFSGGLRLDTEGAAYFALEGRSQLSGNWVGRGTIGVELFRDWEGFDLDLGLTMAGVGQWREAAIYDAPGIGLEFGMGLNLGRIHGEYRAVTPFRDDTVGHIVTERRWRVGFDLVESVQIFGEGLVLDEEAGVTDWEKARAFGAGARVTF